MVYVTVGAVVRGDICLPLGIETEFERYGPEREVLFLFDNGVKVAARRGSGRSTIPKRAL